MQKRTFLRGALSAAFILSTPFILTGCGDEKPAAAAGNPDTAKALGKTKIRVGVTAGPHADIVAKAAEVAKTHGLEVEVVEFSDYVTPDISLSDGALDAAVYQHEPFLRNFNEQKGTKLAVAGHAVVQPMGIYSKRIIRSKTSRRVRPLPFRTTLRTAAVRSSFAKKPVLSSCAMASRGNPSCTI